MDPVRIANSLSTDPAAIFSSANCSPQDAPSANSSTIAHHRRSPAIPSRTQDASVPRLRCPGRPRLSTWGNLGSGLVISK